MTLAPPGCDGPTKQAPVEATEVLLPPADRVELAVGPFEEHTVLAIEAKEYRAGLALLTARVR